tara:strand:+ start:474 stop:602 length:129 start_codon:yes stop_codon:yes gene_type:complete
MNVIVLAIEGTVQGAELRHCSKYVPFFTKLSKYGVTDVLLEP